jgi:hypothetical protein
MLMRKIDGNKELRMTERERDIQLSTKTEMKVRWQHMLTTDDRHNKNVSIFH